MIVRLRETAWYDTQCDLDLGYISKKFCVVYHKLLLHTVLISSVLRLVFILYSCTLTQVGVKCQKTVWYIFGPKCGKDDCCKAPPLAAVESLFG